jgi:hypothetical protein
VDKLLGEEAFYWPDRLLGLHWPFNGLGWSIQVLAIKEPNWSNTDDREN